MITNLFLVIINIYIAITQLNCGYQLYTHPIEKKIIKNFDNNNPRSIFLYTPDLFGPLTRAIKEELCSNHIIILNDNNKYLNENNIHIPVLNIIDYLENNITISVFQDGTKAEYKLIINIKATLTIPDQDCYSIKINVHRNLMNNPEKTLCNYVQEKEIFQEMYQEAAQQLTHNFLLKYSNFLS